MSCARVGVIRQQALIACALALAGAPTTFAQRSAPPARGLSLDQIRGVMRANAGAFNNCLMAASRNGKPLDGPFLYQITVDKAGRVTSAHPFQPSAVPAFDRCIIAVLRRAKFPGGPASFDAPLVFEAS